MKTGSRLRVIYTRSDGSTDLGWTCGPVPHDSDIKLQDTLGCDLGADILYDIAKQSPLEIIKVEIVEVNDGC